MDDLFTRLVEDLAGRVSGPMKFRLILQPLMAAIFAIRSGLKDARMGKPPYFWALFTNPESRAEMLRDGWKSVGRVFILGIIMDVIYQVIAVRRFHPLEALLVAAVLAIVPYLLVRGPVNRIVGGKSGRARE
jgi:hypothetical protein